MPELPEVETIRLGLQKKIVGLTIKKTEVLAPKTFQNMDDKPFDYAQGLRGRKVLKIWRKAKILGMDLSSNPNDTLLHLRGEVSGVPSTQHLGGVCLLFHLKMTGQIIVKSAKGKGKRFIGGHPTTDMVGPLPNRSTRVIFHFSDGSKLYFNDQRRFGWVKILSGDKRYEISDKLLSKLGPEPLEKGFTWQTLKQNLLRHKSMPIKVALLDQTVVSGVGNIYASESCFNARLDPRIKVSNLTDLQFKKLHHGLLKALRDGIKHGGSTRAHFVDPEGHKGYFLDYAFVYGRDKHPCKKCGNLIQKIQLRGRGTYWCSKCQII